MQVLRLFALTWLLIFPLLFILTSPHMQTVERFIAAYNQHDSYEMATFVANDIEWLSITDEQVIAQARGK